MEHGNNKCSHINLINYGMRAKWRKRQIRCGISGFFEIPNLNSRSMWASNKEKGKYIARMNSIDRQNIF
jgi:hypothetical protein